MPLGWTLASWTGGLTPLHWAAMFGLVSTGEILIAAKAPIDAQSNSGETSLHLCAEKGNVVCLVSSHAHITHL
jgi:ankyrin repeat protein